MFISALKRQENIAEYVLYMWQIEDVIRACEFDIEAIEDFILKKQDLSDEHKTKLKGWYLDLTKKMKLQKIEKVGHLHEVNDVVGEINLLHNTLLEYYKDEKYIANYSKAEAFIEEFRSVSNNPKASNIEVMFNALYAKLMLKLQGRDISSGTEEAFDAFRMVLAYLSVKYKEMQAGTLA